MNDSNAFQVGDSVKWTSSSNGSTTSKIGVIEAVVPAGSQLTREQNIETGSFALPRGHVSYLVRVPGKTATSKGKLYWPIANKLTKA